MFIGPLGRAQPRNRGQPIVQRIVFKLAVGYDGCSFELERRSSWSFTELAKYIEHVQPDEGRAVLIHLPAYASLFQSFRIGLPGVTIRSWNLASSDKRRSASRALRIQRASNPIKPVGP